MPVVILECRGVSLHYQAGDGAAGREVLRGVSFALEAGERLNVVGPSGGGKSTLLRLLNRFEDPDQGTVLFHGKDLRAYDPLEVRRRIALTLQTPVMFDGTVRDNLLRHPRERRAHSPRRTSGRPWRTWPWTRPSWTAWRANCPVARSSGWRSPGSC